MAHIAEKLTFFQLFKEKQYQVEIPMIQRDYAQGRDSAQNIRKDFLGYLYDSLNMNQPVELDFVYGQLDGNKFIPLDGQQRLTTLFLLHWYLAHQANQIDILKKALVSKEYSKFAYLTRTTSREFCDTLLTQAISLDECKGKSISEAIRDKTWYFALWDKDPTIHSMLNMLDAIHHKFNTSQASSFFNRLIDAEKPIITFHFLDLKGFQSPDELYIKMNARGKPLTTLEVFKAKLEQLLRTEAFSSKYKLFEKDVSVQAYFSHQIETNWADLFWNYKENHVFDKQFMNFIKAIAVNNYGFKDKHPSIGEFIDGKDIAFSEYKEKECFDEKGIQTLIDTLDCLKNGNAEIKIHLEKDAHYYYDEAAQFKKVIENKLTYPERILFFAYTQYLVKHHQTDLAGLFDWMRVIHNLCIYTSCDKANFGTLIQIIAELLANNDSILTYLEKNGAVKGFDTQQVKEEKIKACLLKKDSNWRNAIISIEKHGYFESQIEFILDFSGILAYYESHNHCNWSEADNATYYNSLIEYSKKVEIIFGAEGLNPFKDFVWERALLTEGNYLLKKGYSSKVHSFLIDKKTENLSWKRLLKNKSDKRNFVKFVLGKINIGFIEDDLNKICQKSLNLTEGIWRSNFIKYPEMIQYLGASRFISDEGNTKYLLKKTTMGGAHAEYYSYAFYSKYFNNPFKPFTLKYYDGNSIDAPRAYMEYEFNNHLYQIEISHSKLEATRYRVKLCIPDKSVEAIHPSIIEILEKQGFKREPHYQLDLAEADLEAKLKIICNAFVTIPQTDM